MIEHGTETNYWRGCRCEECRSAANRARRARRDRNAAATRAYNQAAWAKRKQDIYKKWWLDRYTLDQIHKLAQGLWGDEPDTHGVCARVGCTEKFERDPRLHSKKYCSTLCKKRAADVRSVRHKAAA
jgi:hypothetical protein